MTTLSMKINDFGGPNPPKIVPNSIKNQEKYNKIAVKKSTTNTDEQKYAPRPSRRPIVRPKRRMIEFDAPTSGLIFGPLGPPKVT